MKSCIFNVIFFCCGLISFPSYGQEKVLTPKNESTLENNSREKVIIDVLASDPLDTVYSYIKYEYTVDEQAHFPGGKDSLKHFLIANIHYPERALKNKIGGKCYVNFIVRASGEIADVRVRHGIVDCPECDAEAIRVIKMMPTWVPAKVKGKPMSYIYFLPITFRP